MSNKTDMVKGMDDGAETGLGDVVPAGKKKLSGKALVLFIILPALLVLGGGGGTAMMLMGGGKADAAPVEDKHADDADPKAKKAGKKDDHAKSDDPDGKADTEHEKSEDAHGGVKSASSSEGNGAEIQIGEPGNPSFYTMPKILVTVSNGNGRRSQLLLKLTLESSDPAVFRRVDSVLPRITDQFQMFLREMRVDDLSGSAGDYRIRRELLRRVNLSLAPEKIDAVLIEEFIVQ